MIWLYVAIRRLLFLQGKPVVWRCQPTRLIKPQLLDRRVKMGRSKMRSNMIESGELNFQVGKNWLQIPVAGGGRRGIFQDKVSTRFQDSLLARATNEEQQKMVGYRVNALWKSTEGKYVIAGVRQNGTPARARVNQNGPAMQAAPAPPWLLRRLCPFAQGPRARAPDLRFRPSGCHCRSRCHPSSRP